MAVCMTCHYKAPQKPTPFFPRRCDWGKPLILFTRTFIHPNLELKKVPALNNLGKISIKKNNEQNEENNIQLANTSHPHICHQKLFGVKSSL